MLVLNMFHQIEVGSIVRFMRHSTRRVVFGIGSNRKGARIENEASCEKTMKLNMRGYSV